MRAQYPPNWDEIRLVILERDDHQCTYETSHGRRCRVRNSIDWPLAVAHLNHVKDDCRDANLATLCMTHHAVHDSAHRVAEMKKRRAETLPGRFHRSQVA